MDSRTAEQKFHERIGDHQEALERRARLVHSPKSIKWLADLSLRFRESRIDHERKRFDRIQLREARSASTLQTQDQHARTQEAEAVTPADFAATAASNMSFVSAPPRELRPPRRTE